MENLRELYETIDRLDERELENLQAYIEQRKREPRKVSEDAQEKIKALQDALENFWEGVPQDEIDEIVEAMNSEYIEPLSDYDWLDEKDES